MSTENSETKQKRTKKVDPVCIICDEKLNKSTRLLIQCPFCQFESCRKCCETYALNESTVKCMNTTCGKEWTRKHIREVFTLVFINGPLKEHKEKLLFDQERALLPATQPIIEGKIAAKKIDEDIHEQQKKITEINRVISDLYAKKIQCLNLKSSTRERSAFVRACPDENCRGFLSSQWKCGICEKWTCPECHIVKGYTRDTEHTCNEDDVATARLLAADTKPCPKCATGIFKIDGCDQMWCTQCHTAFSWRTGAIQTNIHNPHFFEWQRRTGENAPRNPNDILCGREMNHYLYQTFSNLLRTNYSNAPNYRVVLSRLDNTIRYAIHLIHVERPIPANYQQRNEDLRVQYLMKEITEEEMKTFLQRDDKRHHRNQEIADIYTLLNNTVTDIIYRYLDFLERNKPTLIGTVTRNIPLLPQAPIDTTILDEIDTIVAYANECLADVAHTYSCGRIVVENNLHLLKGNTAIRHLRELKEKEPENTFV